jgi:hypothetical protein
LRRRFAVTGLATLATVLGTWAAISAAGATSSPSATATGFATPAAATRAIAFERDLAARGITVPPGVLSSGAQSAGAESPQAMSPAAAAANDQFYGVSCKGASDCLAVGVNGTAGRPIGSHWDGKCTPPPSTCRRAPPSAY